MKNNTFNNENDNKISAQRLRDAMHEAQITSAELASRSGVSKASISQYRNGTYVPSNSSAEKMANVLGVSPLWLMGFPEEYLTIDYAHDRSNPEYMLSYAEKVRDVAMQKLISVAKNSDPKDILLVTDMLKKLNERN